MQSKHLVEETLISNLIEFFEKKWLSYQSSSYFSESKEQASISIVASIDHHIKKGFEISWCMGGTINQDGDSRPVFPEIEPDLPFLDDFLMEYYPHISFMQYKVITRQIECKTKTDGDNYGGSTQDATKSLSLFDLSNSMVKSGIIAQPHLVPFSEMQDKIYNQHTPEYMEKYTSILSANSSAKGSFKNK